MGARSRHEEPTAPHVASLGQADLIPDRALTAEDADAFDHSSIAGRLAELVANATTPLNIGLFGPWGSGKSSFCELLRRELAHHKRGAIKVIRYEAAWKFGGAALERNFISHVARALELDEEDKDNREFYRGLYEKRRSADIDMGRLREAGVAVGIWFAVVLVLVSTVLVGLLGVVAWISDSRTWVSLIETTLPQAVASSAAVALLAAVLKFVLTGARVDIEQSQPADEELSATFERLVKRILEKYERVVFFIDELDRCSAKDVVSTLSTIKNFLGHPNCVFVIAADRDVLEKALNKLPQETPANEEEPYYSTASAFLDKVFQHQISLPPLRMRRLTRFAQELVTEQAKQGGLWAELETYQADGKLREDVIYALIPSHVRSPRRVKVLLNNFATNARVAQSRRINHLARGPEIAKLTVLQTEYPLLANDLHLEPRLPSAVLAAMDADDGAADTKGDAEEPTPLTSTRPGSRLARLVARHARGAGDRLIGSTEKTEAALTKARGDELRRYLQRVAAAGIPDPGRDLLYLEAAGAAVGLEDAELGEFIEQVAPDAPGEVISRLADVSLDEQQAAARLLSHMADESVGSERANIVATLMGLCELLGEDAMPVAGVVANALSSYLVAPARSLDEDSLAGALVIARLAEVGEPAPLTDKLFEDERLLGAPERVESVARQAARLPDRHLERVHERIGAFLPERRGVVLSPLAELPADTARSLIRAALVADAVVKELKADASDGSDTEETLASQLLEAARSNPTTTVDLQASVQWLLLRSGAPAAYELAHKNAPTLLPKLADKGIAASHVLRGLEVGPPTDWAAWHALLPTNYQPTPNRLGRAQTALARLLAQTADAPPDAQQAGRQLARELVEQLREASEADTWSAIQPKLQEALNSRTWWTSAEEPAKQEALYRTASELASLGDEVASGVDAALRADIERALAPQRSPQRPSRPPQPPSQEAVIGAGRMALLLREESAAAISTQLDGLYSTENGDSPYDHEVTLARARIAAAVRRSASDVSKPPFEVSLQKLSFAVASRSATGREALRSWLETNPKVDQVKALALISRMDRRAVTEVGKWSDGLAADGRTDLLIGLADASVLTEGWVAEVGAHTLDEDRLVEYLASRARNETRAQDRASWIRLIVAVRPETPTAQRQVADLMLNLLERDTDVDFKNALTLVPALRRGHRRKGALEAAFRNATVNRKIPAKVARDLEHAGISLPKKSFAQKLIKKLTPPRG